MLDVARGPQGSREVGGLPAPVFAASFQPTFVLDVLALWQVDPASATEVFHSVVSESPQIAAGN